MAIPRPFNTVAPRQSARVVIPTIIEQLLLGEVELRLGALNAKRDFCFVQDAITGMIAIGESENTSGAVFRIGINFEVSIGETVNLIA